MAGYPTKKRVAVVGGGIVGLTSAYYLNLRGFQVTLIEGNNSPADVGTSSYQNGGLFCPGTITPWSGPSVLSGFFKNKDGTFKIRGGLYLLNLKLWKFVFQFSRSCMSGIGDYNRRKLALANLGYLSLDKYNHLTKILPDIPNPNPSKGTLALYSDENICKLDSDQVNYMREQLNKPAAITFLGNSSGELIKQNYLPYIKEDHSAKIKGAIYTPEDTSGDSRIVAEKLYKHLTNQGVNFVFNESVTAFDIDSKEIKGLRTDKGNTYTADYYLLTTGPNVELLHNIGIKAPIYPIKGYSIDIPIKPNVNSASIPHMALSEVKAKIYLSRIDNSIRMSGFAELHGFDKSLDPQRKQMFIDYLNKIMDIKNLDLDKSKFCTCHRPVSADGVPLIGSISRYPNLFVNLGQGSVGWTLSFGSADLISCIMSGLKTEIDKSPYDPNRF